MEYRQESVATLHDYGGADPPAPLGETTVVVPVTDRDFAGLAPDQVFRSLSSLPVERVVVPLRAPADRVADIREWLESFDLELAVLWCNAPGVDDLLSAVDLDGPAGKGRDVWLALGLATESEYVVLHDADVRSHEPRDISKLVGPLGYGFSFVKAYYARVEHEQLFGRLFRLFYTPLVEALATRHDDPIVEYLGAFRYALAGEMAMTAELARTMRLPRRWGLEVGTLGEAYREVGFAGSAQVDLGRYEHEHRAVSGPTGLSDMSHGVARALFRLLLDQGVEVTYEDLAATYRDVGMALVDRYEADAWLNDFEYDAEDERRQVETYADAIQPPTAEDRLPAWSESPISVADLEAAHLDAIDGIH